MMGDKFFEVEPLPYPGERAVCASGQPADECNVLPDLVKGTDLFEAQESPFYSAIQTESESGIELKTRSVQAYFPLGCVACGKMCELVVEKINGQRTDKQPAVSWMDADTYVRVRENALKNITRRLRANTNDEKKDKVSQKNDMGSAQAA